MGKPKNTNYWSKEKVEKEARKYKHKIDFKTKSAGAYGAAKKLGIYNNVCAHMVPKKPAPKWTEKSVREVAKKFKHISDFSREESGAYAAAAGQISLCPNFTKRIEFK